MQATAPGPGAPGPPPLRLDDRLAREIVEGAMRRYFESRRAAVPAFVDRHFKLGGTLKLHRKAVGWDIVRAPANLALALPAVTMKLAAAGMRQIGARGLADRLGVRTLLLATAVGREVEWLVETELLELPYSQPGRSSHRDALAEAVLGDARVDAAVAGAVEAISRQGTDADFAARLAEALTTYAGSRAAAAEIAASLVGIGIGVAAFKQITPGVISLGPAVATAIAQQTAIASFPLGAGLGGFWYGLFPASPAASLVAGVTGGLAAAGAVLAAFAGILTDPVQRRLGLHQRRLLRMLDALEANFRGDGPARFVVRDHYVARLLDLFDVVRTVHRLTA